MNRFQLKTGFRRVTWVFFLAAMFLATPGLIQAQASSNMEILREKLKADKKLLIAEKALSIEEAEVALKKVSQEAERRHSGDEGRPLPPDGKQDSRAGPLRPVDADSARGIAGMASRFH